MFISLYKTDLQRNQRRWYALSVQPTLFGEWAFIREWGRIGNNGGQRTIEFFELEAEALKASDTLKSFKTRRGYSVTPHQLTLPF